VDGPAIAYREKAYQEAMEAMEAELEVGAGTGEVCSDAGDRGRGCTSGGE